MVPQSQPKVEGCVFATSSAHRAQRQRQCRSGGLVRMGPGTGATARALVRRSGRVVVARRARERKGSGAAGHVAARGGARPQRVAGVPLARQADGARAAANASANVSAGRPRPRRTPRAGQHTRRATGAEQPGAAAFLSLRPEHRRGARAHERRSRAPRADRALPARALPALRGPRRRQEDEGGRSSRTCPTCRGRRIVGVSLAERALFALDSAGRVRAIAPAERRKGDALHWAHTCELADAAQRAAA